MLLTAIPSAKVDGDGARDLPGVIHPSDFHRNNRVPRLQPGLVRVEEGCHPVRQRSSDGEEVGPQPRNQYDTESNLLVLAAVVGDRAGENPRRNAMKNVSPGGNDRKRSPKVVNVTHVSPYARRKRGIDIVVRRSAIHQHQDRRSIGAKESRLLRRRSHKGTEVPRRQVVVPGRRRGRGRRGSRRCGGGGCRGPQSVEGEPERGGFRRSLRRLGRRRRRRLCQVSAPKVCKTGRASHTEQGEVGRQSFELFLFLQVLSLALSIAVRSRPM